MDPASKNALAQRATEDVLGSGMEVDLPLVAESSASNPVVPVVVDNPTLVSVQVVGHENEVVVEEAPVRHQCAWRHLFLEWRLPEV